MRSRCHSLITQGSIINNLQQEMLQHFSTRVLGPAAVTHGGRTVTLCAGSGPLRENKWNSDGDGVWSQEAETWVGLSVPAWK